MSQNQNFLSQKRKQYQEALAKEIEVNFTLSEQRNNILDAILAITEKHLPSEVQDQVFHLSLKFKQVNEPEFAQTG